jgi:hypothetical protein
MKDASSGRSGDFVGSDVERRLANLSSAKRALLERWQQGEAIVRDHARVVRRRPNGDRDPAPLSVGQERLWQWQKLNSERANALNLHYLLEIRGNLDHVALASSLDEIHRRHECLRSHFVSSGDTVVAQLCPDRHTSLLNEDLSDLPETDALAEARSRAQKLGSRPFDVSTGPLSRAVLYKIARHSYILLLAVHHIVFDQWSMGVVLQELSRLYADFHRKSPPSLEALPVQFADFAYWERRWIDEGAFDRHREYWSKQLVGSAPRLILPGRRPHITDFRRGHVSVRFSDGLSARVGSVARTHNASAYMILLAALAMTLAELTGQTEIVIGNPTANRNYGNIQALIGFFVNNVPMRLSVQPGRALPDFLRYVKRVSGDALAHQELPTSVIAAARSAASQSDLYQVIFSMQNSPVPSVKLGELDVTPSLLDYGATTVDMALFLIESQALTNIDSELAGMIHFNAAVYDETAMDNVWRAFVAKTWTVVRSLEAMPAT